jgi:hypothetical protein
MPSSARHQGLRLMYNDLPPALARAIRSRQPQHKLDLNERITLSLTRLEILSIAWSITKAADWVDATDRSIPTQPMRADADKLRGIAIS